MTPPRQALARASHHTVAPETPLAVATEYPAAIATDDGRYVASGMLEIRERPDGWDGTLRGLDRPGVVASMYFSERLRDVVVRLEDGRTARARITGTSFIAAAARVCHLRGLDPLR